MLIECNKKKKKNIILLDNSLSDDSVCIHYSAVNNYSHILDVNKKKRHPRLGQNLEKVTCLTIPFIGDITELSGVAY